MKAKIVIIALAASIAVGAVVVHITGNCPLHCVKTAIHK